jgi:hypothetical protein
LPTDPGHITNLLTEFVFKVWKQQEDSAIILYYLAPDTIEGNTERKNKKQKITHSRKTKQNITDKREKTNEDQVDFRKLPTYKTLYKIIWKTVSIEIYYKNIHFT